MKKLTYQISQENKRENVYYFLKSLDYSENLIKSLKKQMGQIKINDNSCNVRAKLNDGDILTLIFIDDGIKISPQDIPIDVVYEDEDLLVINKQYGLAVIPTKSHFDKSLFSALANRYGESFPCHIVTRLDRDTSGLMLICKNSLCHSVLNKNLKENIQREYIALVHGIIDSDGIINCPIAKSNLGMKRIVSNEGQEAITQYFVLSHMYDKTLIRVKLYTGRTHQIRVHLSHIGHPLCGDRLYGLNDDGYSRQALHSCKISFVHPILGKLLSFEDINIKFE